MIYPQGSSSTWIGMIKAWAGGVAVKSMSRGRWSMVESAGPALHV